jgi:hypothetical protein
MLPMLPQDKANHLAYGAVIFVVAFVIAASVSTAIPPIVIAGGAVLLFSAAQEVADIIYKGHPSWVDVAATLAGGALVAIPLLV